MQVKLKDIADIRIGYTFRNATDKTEKGEIPLVQMSDLDALTKGKIDTVKSTNLKVRSPDWTLQEGDLLIKGRGTDFIPVTTPQEIQGAVFSHPLLRIRLKKELALPEFISWHLNQPETQKALQRFASGSSVQMLNLQNLKELELELPSLNQQKKIGTIATLLKKEEELLSLLASKRTLLISCSIKEKINKKVLGKKNGHK